MAKRHCREESRRRADAIDEAEGDDVMGVKNTFGWSLWILFPTIIFLHFMFFTVWRYPLTVAPFSLILFIAVCFQIKVQRIWVWGVVALLVPFANLAWAFAAPNHPDVVHYFRTYALWLLSAFAVLVACRADPVAFNRRAGTLERIASACLIVMVAFSFAQVVLFAGWGSDVLYNPFGAHQYLGQYNVSRFANRVLVRAPGLYLEPSFNAFVLVSLYVICLIRRYRLWTTSILTLLGLFFAQSMIGVIAFAVIWLLVLLHSVWSRPVEKLALNRFGLLNLAAALLIAYTGGFGGISHALGVGSGGHTGEQRFDELDMPSTSGYYRLIAPLPVLRDVLRDEPLGQALGQMQTTVSAYHILNGKRYGKTIDNGMYYLVFYFGWTAVACLAFLGGATLKAMFSPEGTNRLIVLAYVIVSLQFSGGVLLPEYILLLVMVLYQFRVNSPEFRERTPRPAGSNLALAG